MQPLDNQRQHPRSQFAHPERVRLLDASALEQLGQVLDASLGGFRAILKKPCAIGTLLQGMIEFPGEMGFVQMIPFTARCAWLRDHTCGFALRELPLASERTYDWLTEHADQI